MTASELKAYIAAQLVVPVNLVSKVINALYAMVDFTTTQVSSIIPDWTNALTFNTDGSGDGIYCKHPDTTGKKRIFETKTDGNINHTPPTNPVITEDTYWREVSSSASAAIPEWAAGIYGPGLIIVYHNHSVDGRGLYVLLEPVRPYNSVNIETEITAGDWEPITAPGSGGGPAIADVYADIAAMLAAQGAQEENAYYWVTDATTDGTVTAGWAIYRKLAASTANLTDYVKVQEQESLDIIAAADASETVKGVAEEATDAEMQAGTATGATGAKLFSTPTKLATWWSYLKTQAQSFTSRLTAKHLAASWSALTDAATIAWDGDANGNFATVTIGGNRTLGAITNPISGAFYTLRVVQDGTGGRTLAFNAQYVFGGTVNPILNSAAGAQTVLSFFYDGTAMRYCGASGDYQLANLYLTLQAATGSNQRPLWIDSTGKIQKSTFINHDNTAKKSTHTGSDDGSSTVQHEWLNNSLNRIMAIFNDQHVEFGGSTMVISVLSAISSGSAYIEINDNQAQAFRIVDKTGNNYITFVSTTGGLAMTFHSKILHDQGTGFSKWHVQAFLRTSTAAGATNVVSFVAIPTDQACSVTVEHLFAYATDGATVIASGAKEGITRNVAATVTGAYPTFSVVADPATTATWSISADNTNKRVNINFINTTGTGKTFDVSLDYTYILLPLPT